MGDKTRKQPILVKIKRRRKRIVLVIECLTDIPIRALKDKNSFTITVGYGGPYLYKEKHIHIENLTIKTIKSTSDYKVNIK